MAATCGTAVALEIKLLNEVAMNDGDEAVVMERRCRGPLKGLRIEPVWGATHPLISLSPQALSGRGQLGG